jgi:putative transcriptional regulator
MNAPVCAISAMYSMIMHKILTLIIACLGSLAVLAAPGGLGDASRAPPETLPPAPSIDTAPATGMFLVARRGLVGPVFRRTVILLMNHDAKGSMGLVLNRRIGTALSNVISGIENDEADKLPMFFGGPMGMQQVYMLLRNSEPIPHAKHITADIHFSTARHVLEDMLARQASGSELHLYIGYAGWGAGQLAMEIERGSWELMESDSEAIFEDSDHTLWERLIEKLEPTGIEVKLDHLLHGFLFEFLSKSTFCYGAPSHA